MFSVFLSNKWWTEKKKKNLTDPKLLKNLCHLQNCSLNLHFPHVTKCQTWRFNMAKNARCSIASCQVQLQFCVCGLNLGPLPWPFPLHDFIMRFSRLTIFYVLPDERLTLVYTMIQHIRMYRIPHSLISVCVK